MDLPEEVINAIKKDREAGMRYKEIYPRYSQYNLKYWHLDEIFGILKPGTDDGPDNYFEFQEDMWLKSF